MEGPIVNLVTPMNKDGDIDFSDFENLINYQNKNGIENFWICGSAGEDFGLSLHQKLSFIEYFEEVNIPKCNFIFGVGSLSYSDSKKLTKSISSKSSLKAIHYLCYDQKLGDGQYERIIKDITNISTIPLYLYHNPKRGRPIKTKNIKELKKIKNIKGVKIGGYSLSEFLNFKNNASPYWDLFCAGGAQMLACMSIGFNAHSTSDANIFPKLFKLMYENYKEGNKSEAESLQNLAIKLSQMIPRNNNGEYSAEEKFILSLDNIVKPYVNASYKLLNKQEQESCLNVYNIYKKELLKFDK